MQKNVSIKKNMLMSTVLTASNFVFPLITYAYVARILLPSGTGKVAFVQSALSYFSYVAALGVSGYGTRECAKVRDDKEKLSRLVQEIFCINLCSTLIAYIALAVSIAVISKFQSYRILFIVMSCSILLQTLGMEWLYNALEQYTYITIRSIVFKSIAAVMTFLLIKSAEDYIIYGGIVVFTSSASYILNFINVRKYITFKRFEKYNLKRHMKPIMVFFFSTIVISIYGQFDSLMLGFIKGDDSVGIYNAALKIKSVVLSLSTAITSVLIPRMSLYYSGDKKNAFIDLLTKSMRVTFLLMIPLACFIIVNAENIIRFICGDEYTVAVPTLIVLMLCAIALAFTNVLGNQVLIPKGLEKRYSMSVFIGMFINLGLNSLMIPFLDSFGAAVATLITETFNAVYMGIGCKEEIGLVKKQLKVRKYIIPTIVSLLVQVSCVYFTARFSLIVCLTINTIVYFGIFYGIQLFQRDPIIFSVAKKIMKKFKIDKRM